MARRRRGLGAGRGRSLGARGRERGVPLAVCVFVGSRSEPRPSGSTPLGVPAPAPSLQAQAAPSGPRQRAPPVVCSRGLGWRGAAASLIPTPARSPDSWTRRPAAFPGYIQTGLQRGPADRAAGAVCDKGEAEGNSAGVGSPDSGFLQAALGPGGAHSEADSSRLRGTRSQRSSATTAGAGTEACICSPARAARRHFPLPPGV